MAINTDGQKKIGRFLKKGSKLLSCVSMVEFSFDEILENLPLGYDNTDRSIINTRFHDPEEIDRGVKQSPSINNELSDINKPRHGVIFPADFTQDWYNERLNKKRRRPDQDEDDEDFETSNFSRVSPEIKDQSSPGVTPENANHSPLLADDWTEALEGTDNRIAAQPVSPESVRNTDSNAAQKLLNTDRMSAAISKAFTQSSNPSGDAKTSHQDTFTPLPTKTEQSPVAAEERAIETWKNQQMIAKENEQILEELRSQARSEGFQAGFREGEEKGLISGQKKAAQVFSKVEEIITEFEGLKSIVLDNVQKNFYELSQAIAEALLGREFSIKPEAYATMIQRIIKDTISPNEFRVKMHPDTWQRVVDLGIQELTPHLLKDPTIAVGEFRVESSLTVVDVSAKKLVQQLLEKADISLFDDKKAV